MTPQRLFREIHRWGSIVIAFPLVLVIGAGVLLMLKKDFDWIQPPTIKADQVSSPKVDLPTLFESARNIPQAEISGWRDLARVDFKPDKGIVKFITHGRYEIQIDVATGKVLHHAVRRSDLIEELHDGSFFGAGVKRYIFLPIGIILFILWLTGIYLFILPYMTRAKKRKRKSSDRPNVEAHGKVPGDVSPDDISKVPAE